MLPDAFKAHPILVMGHRGSPLRAPENTLLSFQKALEEGALGIEFDIRLSKDHEVFVYHDEKMGRLTKARGFFRECTSKKLRFLNLRHRRGISSDISIPFLEEALKDFGKRCVLYIELKVDPSKERSRVLAQETMLLLEEFDLIQRSILVSFNYDVVKWIKGRDARFSTGFNFTRSKDLNEPRKDKYQYLDCLCPRSSCLNAKLMKEASSYQLGVLTWVVNNRKSLQRVLKLGVQGIVTDDPKKIINYLSRMME
jgi:glycerophosphoryl diester phosphodiesterase